MPQTKLYSVYDEVFMLSPKPLQEVCLSTITEKLPVLTSMQITPVADDKIFKETRHFAQGVPIPDKLAEKILEDFSKKGVIRDDTLTLFSDVAKYNLKVLKLPDINMHVSGCSLLEYWRFSFREVHLGCNNIINRWSIRKLCDSFAGSRYSLTSLHLDLYPAVNITAGTMFDYFVQFPNLKLLQYNTPISGNSVTFKNKNWINLFSSCPLLEILKVSINGSSKDVELDSRIFMTADKLQSLSLFSALKSSVAIETFSCVEYFLQLNNLRELDLSIDMDPPDVNLIRLYNNLKESHTDILAVHIDKFLELSVDKLPLLEALDLSGIYRTDDMKIQLFIETHDNLRFLGLCMLQSKFCVNGDTVAYYPHLQIAGCYLESQIIISLLKYSKRATYMKEVLKGLFQVTAGWTQTRRPHVLKIVLEIMEEFKTHMQLQMAATACVFHLTKERERDTVPNELNFNLLSEIARVTSMILVIHVSNLQMVKNCLLIICTDKILHNAIFDRVSMSRLCLNCMISYPENVDRHVTRMAVAIISILACKISSQDTANLMKDREMKLLLDIVEQRLKTRTVDGTLKFDLSALWNLTDESPAACKRFVDLDGPTKYLKLLEVFADDMHVETKVLGLLNNIAEVEFLQVVMLLNKGLMERVSLLITNQLVQVSYFACGIIANLALRWDEIQTVLNIEERKKILSQLDEAISRWGTLETEIVTYRSFKPFYELLNCADKPEIQRWAVWAIHHVCSLSKNYKKLMDDTCLDLLRKIHAVRTNRPELRLQIEDIYKVTGNAHLLEDMMQIDTELSFEEEEIMQEG